MLNGPAVDICLLGSSVVLHGTEPNSQVYQVLSILYILIFLREAIPLCVQNTYTKIRQTQQKVIYWSADHSLGNAALRDPVRFT
jgi:hypothetical protein